MADALALVLDSGAGFGAHRRLTFANRIAGDSHAAGISDRRDRLARALDRGRRRRGRHSRRPVRHRRRRHHRAGAVRSLPRARTCRKTCACSSASAPRSPSSCRPRCAPISATRRKARCIPQVVRLWALPAIVGVAIGSVTAAFAPAPVFKIAFVVFASFIAVAHAVRRRPLESRQRIARPRAADVLRLHHRAVFVAGRRQRRRGVERGAHALRPADAARGRRPRPASACRSRLPARSATSWPAGRTWRELPPLSIGFVSLIGLVLMAPVSSYTAGYGVRLAHWLPRRKLEIAFGIFLVAGRRCAS